MYNQLVSSNISGLPANILEETQNNFPKGPVCQFHIHDEIEILMITSGTMRVYFNDEIYVDVKSPDGIFINRRVPHSTERMEHGTSSSLLQVNIEKMIKMEHKHMNRYLSLIFSGDENDYYILKNNSPEKTEICGYMNYIIAENQNQKQSFNTYIRGYLFLILGALYRYNILNDIEPKYDSDGINKIYKALLFVDKNYASPIILDEISSVVNMNPSYFCRVFKKVTGKTLMEYVNFVRIYKAENLLTSTEESILDISVETGFSSVSYFNRVFKNLKDASPAAYRKIKYLK